ncbi:hypothetical protein [Chloroflexus sp.]|nr:hypothetical protein [Chloroflexus sp.]
MTVATRVVALEVGRLGSEAGWLGVVSAMYQPRFSFLPAFTL